MGKKTKNPLHKKKQSTGKENINTVFFTSTASYTVVMMFSL